MTDVTLLPCPFCGGKAKSVRVSDDCHQTYCPSLCVVSSMAELSTKSESIAAWNTRPAPPLTPELIERVLKFVGEEQLRALPTVKVKP